MCPLFLNYMQWLYIYSSFPQCAWSRWWDLFQRLAMPFTILASGIITYAGIHVFLLKAKIFTCMYFSLEVVLQVPLFAEASKVVTVSYLLSAVWPAAFAPTCFCFPWHQHDTGQLCRSTCSSLCCIPCYVSNTFGR